MLPQEFLFGASLSGFQFEMGRDTASVDENTDWFNWVHDDLNVVTGIVSGDFPENGPGYWNNFKAFHDMAEESGMNSLRVGIEWSRVFPRTTSGIDMTALSEACDKSVVDHYRSIMTDIKKRGMKLMVNLNHFTLPSWCHDPIAVNRRLDMSRSGWADRETAHEFIKYALFAVECFDDLVDFWSTLNEPNIVAMNGYFSRGSGFPPSIVAPDLWKSSLENQINAHRMAYRKMKALTKKPVGVIYATIWFDGDDSREKATDLLNWKPLDAFLEESDFLGVNYYSRNVVEAVPGTPGNEDHGVDWRFLDGFGYYCTPDSFSRTGNPSSDNGWEFYPEGLYKTVSEISRRYSIPLYITENGVADEHDVYRSRYIVEHVYSIEKLVSEGCDIRGYFHWSLTDNYEWALGTSMCFGLAKVDFLTGQLIPRPSLYLYREVARSRSATRFTDLSRHEEVLEEHVEAQDGND